MRISCNGCRVLRKGCSSNCSIQPCLQWINSSESQANATVFLAKFNGRAGLINLINAAPDHLRPAVFQSLLYEACGRIVNPIYGSVGLLWSGDWSLCQAAVEAVLKGEPITPVSAAVAPSIKGYDIRHVPKDLQSEKSSVSEESSVLQRVKKVQSKLKRRRAEKPMGGKMAVLAEAVAQMLAADDGLSPSRESPFSHGETSHTTESVALVETAEAAAVVGEDVPREEDFGLDLRLGL